MKSLIAKMDQLSQVDEAKPDFLDLVGDGEKISEIGDTHAGKKKLSRVADRAWTRKMQASPASFNPMHKIYDPEEIERNAEIERRAEKRLSKPVKEGKLTHKDSFDAGGHYHPERVAEATKKKSSKDDHEDKEKVDEAIAIQADGQEAMALLDMLKLAGQPAPQQGPEMTVTGCGMAEADRDPSYANTPDEEVADMSAATPSGTDMHREKEGWRAAAGADNPMVAAMEGKLRKMFESLSKEVVSEVSSKTKQAWLDKAVPDHYDKFVGKKPTTKKKLDTRRATIQKVSKELTGKKQFTDIDPVTGKWSND